MRAVRKTGAPPLEDGTATAMPMDRAKLEAFAQKAIADVGSTLTTLMCSLGGSAWVVQGFCNAESAPACDDLLMTCKRCARWSQG
jgi:hypothetical protein